MEIKCSGLNCPMQYGKINTENCDITETCSYFTPKTTICAFCKVFPATQEIQGNPCCDSCKSHLIWQSNFRKYLQGSKGLKKFLEKARCENN